MLTLDKMTIASARWTVRQGDALRRRIKGRKPSRKERQQIAEMLGRLAVAYRDLKKLTE